MPYKYITFKAPAAMLKIAKPLFGELNRSACNKQGQSGSIIFQIFEDGMGGGAFIPCNGANKINKIIKSYHKKGSK